MRKIHFYCLQNLLWYLKLQQKIFLSKKKIAMCRRWFPGQSGDRTCLNLYKTLGTRPFQLLPPACTDISSTPSWKFFPPPSRISTCHCFHLVIVLSSLVSRKYLLIFFVHTFPEEMSLVSIKNVTFVAIYPKQPRFLSTHLFSKQVSHHAELLIAFVNSVLEDSQ